MIKVLILYVVASDLELKKIHRFSLKEIDVKISNKVSRDKMLS